MKQKYFSLILFLCGFVLQAQTTTITYNHSGAGGAEDSSTFNVTLNNLTTCQNSVILNVDGYGYNPTIYPVKYKVIVNETTTIATMQYGVNNYNLDAYMPITSIKVKGDGNVSAWINLNATLNVESPNVSMPTTGPTVSDVTYLQNATTIPLTATLNSTGTTLKWYTSENGKNYTATPPTPITTTLGTTSYWVAQSNSSGCESVRSRINVNVVENLPATHLKFDGTNDMINIGELIPQGSSYTKEAMINTSNISGSNIISNGSAAFWFWQGNIQSGHGGGFIDVRSSGINLLNTWAHVAITYNAPTNTMKLYVNGSLVSQNTNVASYRGGTMQIGAFNNGSLFNGSMDEVRFWNYARSEAEINHYKNCELQNVNETGLIAYFKFNQGQANGNNTTITTLTDATTNANNGTLVNFALSDNTSNWLAGSPIATGVTCTTLSEDKITLSTLKIYPNPTKGTLNIDAQENISLDIYDTLGKHILNQKIAIGQTLLNIDKYPMGIYLIQIKNEEGESKNFKVVKH